MAEDFQDEEQDGERIPTLFDQEAPYFSVALRVDDVPEGEDPYIGGIRCQAVPRPGEVISFSTYGPQSPLDELTVDLQVISIRHLAYNMSFAGPSSERDWISRATAMHAWCEVVEDPENYLNFDTLLAWRRAWVDAGKHVF